MTQKRLSALAVLSNEVEITSNIYYEEIRKKFSKSGKVRFH